MGSRCTVGSIIINPPMSMEQIQKLEKRIFFQSDEFNLLFEIIKNDRITHESLFYQNHQIKGVSAAKFTKVCDSIYSCLEDQIQSEDMDSLPNLYIDFKGVRFHSLVGTEGNTYWTTRN